MNRLNKAILVTIVAGFLSASYAGASKNTNVNPGDKPIVTTWSKIKELFQ